MDYSKIDWGAAAQSTLSDLEKSKTQPTGGSSNQVDLTKYFTLSLPDKENSGEKIFRIIPMDPTDPTVWFAEAKFHNIKVGSRYVKLYDPAQDGEESPLTEMFQQLIKGDKDERKLAMTYKAKSYYIVKGIERGKEHEGVKFWRFSNTDDGIMEKLRPIIQRLNNRNSGDGAIWRPDAGRDLIVTLNRDKRKYVIATSIIADDATPLSDDPNVMNSWLNDTLTWKDIFRKKPVDYLRIIAEGGEPTWDAESKKFVAKVDLSEDSHQTPQIQTPYVNTTEPTHDYSEEPVSVNTDDLPF